MRASKLKCLLFFLAIFALLCAHAAAEGDVIASGTCGVQGDNLVWALDSEGTLTITGEGEMVNCYSTRPWDGYGADIKDVVIGDGITTISSHAFQNYYNLKSVTFQGGGVTSGYQAFESCSALENVYAPSLEAWMSMRFNDTYSSPMNVAGNLYIDGMLLEELVIPAGTTHIYRTAFKNCSSLKSVSIPDSVTEIGIGAFSQCSGLTEIDIPSSVTKIGSSAFQGCSNLADVSLGEGVTEIGEAAFSHCAALESISLPDGLTVLGGSAFYYCSGLKRIAIPEGVTTIEAYTFDNCTSLTEAELHDGITYIDMYAFYHCTALEHIDLPNACEKIDNYAFEGCTGLKKIILPEKLQTVDTQAFAYCTNLTDIIVTGANTRFYAYAFEGCKSIQTLLFSNEEAVGHDRQAFTVYYPMVYCYSGSGAYNWAYAYGYRFVQIDGVGVSELKTIELPDGVKAIGAEAFLNTGANCIVLPDGCESIASRAFANCSRLVSITMPDSVTSIADDAFERSTHVTFICESLNTAQAYAEVHGFDWTVAS